MTPRLFDFLLSRLRKDLESVSLQGTHMPCGAIGHDAEVITNSRLCGYFMFGTLSAYLAVFTLQ